MSSADDIAAEARMLCCASCGKLELDDIKLMECADCKSVRYCSDACQQDHRPEHEAVCKERAAELRDEILFKQPKSSHLGDCPICSLPMPIEVEKTTSYSCCSKLVCMGCGVFDFERQSRENAQVMKCPFCRHSLFKSSEAVNKNTMKRIAANDPDALCKMGREHFRKGDDDVAFEYLTKAAELGDTDAHYLLSIMYMKGHGVEMDEKKEVYHLEVAAIAGHPMARFRLGYVEAKNDRFDRALKHFIIAATLGLDRAIQELKECYKDGLASKDDFAAALRAYHAAAKAMKSPQREAVEKAR